MRFLTAWHLAELAAQGAQLSQESGTGPGQLKSGGRAAIDRTCWAAMAGRVANHYVTSNFWEYDAETDGLGSNLEAMPTHWNACQHV